MALDRTWRVDKVDCDRVAIEPATGQGQDGERIASLAPHHRLRPRAQLAVAIIVEAFEGFRQICAGGCIGRCGQRGCAPGCVSKKRVGDRVCGLRRLLERQRGRGGEARRYRCKQEDPEAMPSRPITSAHPRARPDHPVAPPRLPVVAFFPNAPSLPPRRLSVAGI
jgi:hypothetical protein